MTTLVRTKRLDLGITEVAAATNARIHPTAWCRYEKGRQRPTRPVAERIAQVLNTTVSDLWPEGVKELGGVMVDRTEVHREVEPARLVTCVAKRADGEA